MISGATRGSRMCNLLPHRTINPGDYLMEAKYVVPNIKTVILNEHAVRGAITMHTGRLRFLGLRVCDGHSQKKQCEG